MSAGFRDPFLLFDMSSAPAVPDPIIKTPTSVEMLSTGLNAALPVHSGVTQETLSGSGVCTFEMVNDGTAAVTIL